MRAREARALDPEEIREKIREAEEELFNLRFQRVVGQVDNPMRFRILRREIARLKTVLREKEMRR